MSTQPEIAARMAERTLVLARAERRAPLLAAAGPSRSTPIPAPVVPTTALRGRLTCVLGFLRRGRRPGLAWPG